MRPAGASCRGCVILARVRWKEEICIRVCGSVTNALRAGEIGVQSRTRMCKNLQQERHLTFYVGKGVRKVCKTHPRHVLDKTKARGHERGRKSAHLCQYQNDGVTGVIKYVCPGSAVAECTISDASRGCSVPGMCDSGEGPMKRINMCSCIWKGHQRVTRWRNQCRITNANDCSKNVISNLCWSGCKKGVQDASASRIGQNEGKRSRTRS